MILIGSPASLFRIRTRSLEMMLATLMVTCGVTLLWPGETFLLPHWSVMRATIKEETLGGWLVCVGIIRWIAIWINGRMTTSPLLRILGCGCGGAFWLGLTMAVWESFTEKLYYGYGVPLFFPVSVTCLFAEIYSAYRCGVDAADYDSLGLRRRARERKHAIKTARRND